MVPFREKRRSARLTSMWKKEEFCKSEDPYSDQTLKSPVRVFTLLLMDRFSAAFPENKRLVSVSSGAGAVRFMEDEKSGRMEKRGDV